MSNPQPLHVQGTQAVTTEQLMAEISRLRQENTNLLAKGTGLKISDKGAVSLYGVGKWPVTLYMSQWEVLLAKAEEIKAFIAANSSQLSVKQPKQA